MKKCILLILCILFIFPTNCIALYDPLSRENNKYGIHLADPNDIDDAADLVNSSGGSWGYVTIVIPETDRNTEKWQERFNLLRRKKLIPLVRLAGEARGPLWMPPSDTSIRDWVTFLDSLNWPTENRYVILFNEPNHAKEWGGILDPEGYANIFVQLATKLKERSEDFYILPAGLDMSAISDGASLEGSEYLRRMIRYKPEIVKLMDGWNSHSYPNPAFSGSPIARGKGTIASFQWELDYLRQLGLQKNPFPVFITETGWVTTGGKNFIPGYYTSDMVGTFLTQLSNGLWQDNRIVAITPFVYSYQDVPFDHFSWIKFGSRELYPHALIYQSLPKVNAKPKIRHSYQLLDTLIPDKLVVDSTYTLSGRVKNTGQAILSSRSGYQLALSSQNGEISYIAESVPDMEPGSEGVFVYHIKTPQKVGQQEIIASLVGGGEELVLTKKTVSVVPPPSLTIKVQLGFRATSKASDVSVIVYDGDAIVHKFEGLEVNSGMLYVTGLTNVVPGKIYRVVALVPYYLPRQEFVTIAPENTQITLKRFWPFDYNRNGKAEIGDFVSAMQLPPRNVVGLFTSK